MKTNWNLIGLIASLVVLDSACVYILTLIIAAAVKLNNGELNEWMALRHTTYMHQSILQMVGAVIVTAVLVMITMGWVNLIKEELNKK